MPLYDFRCACGHEEERHVALVNFLLPVPCECGNDMQRLISAPRVMSDIEPYQAMGTDVATGKAPMIASRSQHREYLNRNGYIEVGNETLKPMQRPTVTDNEIAKDVKKSIEQIGARL